MPLFQRATPFRVVTGVADGCYMCEVILRPEEFEVMRRNNLDICVNILEAAVGGTNKTRVVVKSNLNFGIVKEYLNTLIDGGFLAFVEDGRYATTEKGLKFIDDYYALIEPMNHKTRAGLSQDSHT